MGGGYAANQRFEEQYHCYSVSVADKSHLEKGDKILMPPSAFDTLARLQVDYPMLFKLSTNSNQHTHCGVLEFTAEEGTCYIPFWMMQNLLIEEGTVISVTNVSLPKATFIKLQPQHVDFLEISNPRAVLEHALRNFSCVTAGDVIQIPYNNKNYQFELKEVKPQDAVCIIETDCNLDFDAPVGYKEPDYKSMQKNTGTNNSSNETVPSSTTSSTTSSSTNAAASGSANNNNADVVDSTPRDPNATRIVNGKIIRPSDEDNNNNDSGPSISLADRIGETGVQRNAAIPEKAPEVGYWAVNARGGARLDGKKPADLKDKDGNVVDIRKLRAEAAARRAEEAQKKFSKNAAFASGGGRTVSGERQPQLTTSTTAAAVATSSSTQRKKRVGSKFSRMKQQGQVAFNGSANTFKGEK